MKPPFFIVITSERMIDADEAAAIISVANSIDGLLHLRKPSSSQNEVAELLMQMNDTALSRVVLHQHYDLATRFSVAGIHLPERERMAHLQNYDHFLKAGSVSTSFHTFAAITESNFPFTYSFLSPIFNSISKNNYKAAFSEQELEQYFARADHKIPLVALGGITEQTLPIAHRYGFSGVALLGSIWQSSDAPSLALARMQTCFDTSFGNN